MFSGANITPEFTKFCSHYQDGDEETGSVSTGLIGMAEAIP
jgi:hypothetical protein